MLNASFGHLNSGTFYTVSIETSTLMTAIESTALAIRNCSTCSAMLTLTIIFPRMNRFWVTEQTIVDAVTFEWSSKQQPRFKCVTVQKQRAWFRSSNYACILYHLATVHSLCLHENKVIIVFDLSAFTHLTLWRKLYDCPRHKFRDRKCLIKHALLIFSVIFNRLAAIWKGDFSTPSLWVRGDVRVVSRPIW